MVQVRKEFAPQYPRTPEGWWDFGRDVELRKQLFPKEAFEHPAKASLHMVREMAKYITEPGESILDPFAGTGSQLVSALDERKVVLIELEPYFIDIIKQTLDNWRNWELQDVADVFVYQGDCRQVLQQLDFQVDAAIFSPPYSTTMAASGIRLEGEVEKRIAGGMDATQAQNTSGYKTKEYARSALNLSRLNPFYYLQAMDAVMKRLAKVVVPGGQVCIISKDRIEGPKRILFSDTAINRAQRNGFKLVEWLKHQPPSTIAKASQTIAMRKHGREVNVVLDEDLLIFSRES